MCTLRILIIIAINSSSDANHPNEKGKIMKSDTHTEDPRFHLTPRCNLNATHRVENRTIRCKLCKWRKRKLNPEFVCNSPQPGDHSTKLPQTPPCKTFPWLVYLAQFRKRFCVLFLLSGAVPEEVPHFGRCSSTAAPHFTASPAEIH